MSAFIHAPSTRQSSGQKKTLRPGTGGLDDDGLRRYRRWHLDWLAGNAAPVLSRHGMAGALRLTAVLDRAPVSSAAAPTGETGAGCITVAAAAMVLRLLRCESNEGDGW